MVTYPYSREDCYAAMRVSPVGGREGHTISDRVDQRDCDVTVSNGSEFYDALREDSVTSLYVDGDINISGDSVAVRSHKVIAGDYRGGSMLYSTDLGKDSHAYDAGEGARGHITFYTTSRITGVDIRGGFHDHWSDDRWPAFDPKLASDSGWDAELSQLLSLRGDVEIDNCDIWGASAIAMSVGSASGYYCEPHIHHCKITDTMKTSAGYGIDVFRGRPHIEYCFFDGHRHSICGYGPYNCSYVLENCLFGPHHSSHQVDMHGLSNNPYLEMSDDYDDENYNGNAGGELEVRHNTFTTTHIHDEPESFDHRGDPRRTWAISVRGIPWPRTGEGIVIENNRFVHPDVGENGEGSGIRDFGHRGAFNQQISGGGTYGFSAQNIRDDGFTSNYVYRNNMYESVGKPYSPDHGAPVDIENASRVVAGSDQSTRFSQNIPYAESRIKPMKDLEEIL